MYLQRGVQENKNTAARVFENSDEAIDDFFHDQHDNIDIIDSNCDNENSDYNSKHDVSLIYFSFWYCFYVTLTVGVLFWTDLVPGFGTAKDIHTFGEL